MHKGISISIIETFETSAEQQQNGRHREPTSDLHALSDIIWFLSNSYRLKFKCVKVENEKHICMYLLYQELKKFFVARFIALKTL